MRSEAITNNPSGGKSSSPSKKRRKYDQSPSRGTVSAATASGGGSGMSSSSSKRSRMVVDGDGGSSNSYSAAGAGSTSMTMSKSGSRSYSSSATGYSSSSSSSPELFFAEFCEIPFTLRTLLVEESTYITRKGFDSLQFPDHDLKNSWRGRPARSVHVLPARVTVYQVLQQYQKKRTKNSGSGSSNVTVDKQKLRQVRKFVEGLAALFDDCLPKLLLYQEERPQYEAIQNDEDLKLRRPCEIYGNTYLLRLMLRLPILLRAEPPQEMVSMGPMIADLIVLLQKNRLACFGKESYREPRHDELLPFERKLADDYNRSISSSGSMMVMDVTSPSASTSTTVAAHNDEDCNKSIMSES